MPFNTSPNKVQYTTTTQHQANIQRMEYAKVVESKRQQESCATCRHAVMVRPTMYCNATNTKPVKHYNICHRHHKL